MPTSSSGSLFPTNSDLDSVSIVIPRVRVVVVNYDGGDVTMRCISALDSQTYPRPATKIVVIDNGSIDGLVRKLPQLFPDIGVVELLTNEGFARGNNLAMSDLEGVDVVALVNNDAIPDPRWLEELVTVLESDETIGAACSKMVFNKRVIGFEIDSGPTQIIINDVKLDNQSIVDSIVFDERFALMPDSNQLPSARRQLAGIGSLWFDTAKEDASVPALLSVIIESESSCEISVRTSSGTTRIAVASGISEFSVAVEALSDVINNAGGGVFPGLHGGDIGFKEVDFGQYETPREVFSFCGGAVALRADTLRDVGLFDPSYFLYYEDMDLSWRMRFAGWKIQYVPTSVVRHEHAFSSGEWSPFFRFWVDRNRRLTLVKNAPRSVAVKAITGATVWAIRDSFVPVLRSLIRFRRPNLGACRYRMKQYGSFLKALPAAVQARRHQLRNSKLKPDFVYSWISTR